MYHERVVEMTPKQNFIQIQKTNQKQCILVKNSTYRLLNFFFTLKANVIILSTIRDIPSSLSQKVFNLLYR